MRAIIFVGLVVLLTAGVAYSAAMTGTAKMLGGGSDDVPHCQVLDYNVPASGAISSVNANVKCDLTRSYTVTSTVTSGAASGSGETAASLTANTPQVVAVTISPSVAITGTTYNVDILVKR